MAKITWLGEDELHEGAPGPSFAVAYGGIKFTKGVPVNVSDNSIISRAKTNQYFDVDDSDEFASMHSEPKRRGRPPNVKTEENV